MSRPYPLPDGMTNRGHLRRELEGDLKHLKLKAKRKEVEVVSTREDIVHLKWRMRKLRRDGSET